MQLKRESGENDWMRRHVGSIIMRQLACWIGGLSRPAGTRSRWRADEPTQPTLLILFRVKHSRTPLNGEYFIPPSPVFIPARMSLVHTHCEPGTVAGRSDPSDTSKAAHSVRMAVKPTAAVLAQRHHHCRSWKMHCISNLETHLLRLISEGCGQESRAPNCDQINFHPLVARVRVPTGWTSLVGLFFYLINL